MPRADLLLKLVQAGHSGNKDSFKRVVESIIAEERGKHHSVLAKNLEDIIHNSNTSEAPKIGNVYNNKLDSILYSIFPQTSLDDLVLDDYLKNTINELIEEHYRADLLRNHNIEPRNRVLLIGEPGNGKTSLAEAIATALHLPFFVVRYEGIIGSYLGETASRLAALFDYIRTQQCVLFFDEFDSIGKERGDEHETGEIKRVVSSLLLQIDKLPTYVITVAATNHPELLDRAVWRRYQIRLELNKPTQIQIEDFLKKSEYRTGIKFSASLKYISSKLKEISYAEINEFVKDYQRKFILNNANVDINSLLANTLKKNSIKKKTAT